MTWYFITYADQSHDRVKAVDFLSAVEWAVAMAKPKGYRVISVYEE